MIGVFLGLSEEARDATTDNYFVPLMSVSDDIHSVAAFLNFVDFFWGPTNARLVRELTMSETEAFKISADRMQEHSDAVILCFTTRGSFRLCDAPG